MEVRTYLAHLFYFLLLDSSLADRAGLRPRRRRILAATSGHDLIMMGVYGSGWALASLTFGIGVSMLGVSVGFALIFGISAFVGALLPLFAAHRDLALGQTSSHPGFSWVDANRRNPLFLSRQMARNLAVTHFLIVTTISRAFSSASLPDSSVLREIWASWRGREWSRSAGLEDYLHSPRIVCCLPICACSCSCSTRATH